jgi:uncharacterized coiled-coil protein SlyX
MSCCLKSPPHTTHRLQPLDVGIFGPLQRAWQKQCLEVLDETGQGVTRQQLVKEYMKARTKSIKNKLILGAWKKTGIRPFNPQIFTDEDFGPSFVSSTNRPLPDSFPVANTISDSSSESSYSSSDGTYNGNNDEDSDGRDSESEEGNLGGMERDERDTEAASQLNNAADSLNQDNLPVSAESTTLLSQQPTPLTNVEDRRLLREEGGRNPSEQPNIGEHSHPCRQTSQSPCSLVYSTRRQTRSTTSRSMLRSTSSYIDTSKSVEEQLKRRIQDLEDTQEHQTYVIQGLESQCHLAGKVITQLQGQLHAKEAKKGSSARAKTVGARVLTSEEGRQELEQLRAEARQKEQRQAEVAARKSANDNARRK